MISAALSANLRLCSLTMEQIETASDWSSEDASDSELKSSQSPLVVDKGDSVDDTRAIRVRCDSNVV